MISSTTAMATSSTFEGVVTPLLALVLTLGVSPRVVEMVRSSGCETPADWKFAILQEPDDVEERRLWKAVRQAPALDIQGMANLAAQAQAQQRQKAQPSPSFARKARFFGTKDTAFQRPSASTF